MAADPVTECGFCEGEGLTRFHAEWIRCPYCDGTGLAPQAAPESDKRPEDEP